MTIVLFQHLKKTTMEQKVTFEPAKQRNWQWWQSSPESQEEHQLDY